MRIFVYEWGSGGGLLGREGPAPPSLLAEGVAMARAVGEDLARIDGARVTLLRDIRVAELSARGCRLLQVDSADAHTHALQQQSVEADAVILIAPETDGELLNVVKDAERAGARLASPGAEFVAVASDKAKTAERLHAAGVPVPSGRTLESGEPLPQAFDYPAVVKPLDGAGSQDTYVVTSVADEPPAYAWPRRLERYCPGAAASVAVLMAPGGVCALAPCRQRLSSDGRLRYLGGSTPLAPGLASRAERLARQAIAALPPAIGYAGVDLVLGADPGGGDDVVIEINPRLTTSYAGLRFAAKGNLAESMLACVRGETPAVTFDPRPLEFGADGVVSYAEG